MAKLTLGYKASAEQFAPKDLLEFGIAAEKNGFDSVVVSDHYQPWNHTDGHAPHSFTWLAALGQKTSNRQARHQRRHADVPLPPGDHRPDDGHARSALAGTGLPRRRHRRGAERGGGAGHQVARVQGAVRPAARVDRADAAALDRGPRLVPGRVLPDPRRDGLRQADRRDAAVHRRGRRGRPRCWPAGSPKGSSAPAARPGTCTPRRCCRPSRRLPTRPGATTTASRS